MKIRSGVVALVATTSLAVCIRPPLARAALEIPSQFVEATDRLTWEDGITIEDAVAFSGRNVTKYLALTAKTTSKDGSIPEYRLIVLKAGSPATVIYTATSFGMRLYHPISGTDINADGDPEIIAMTDPGGSGPASQTSSILSVLPDSVKEIYSGPLFKILDLDRDGLVDLVEIHENLQSDARPLSYTAMKWTESKYARSQALERRPSFKRMVAEQEQAHRTAMRRLRLASPSTPAAAEVSKARCKAVDATYLVMALKIGAEQEKAFKDCRVAVGMLRVVVSNSDGWTFVNTMAGDGPVAAAIKGTYMTGSIIATGDLRFLGNRRFRTDRGAVWVLPAFVPLSTSSQGTN